MIRGENVTDEAEQIIDVEKGAALLATWLSIATSLPDYLRVTGQMLAR
jgi:hypothetical protein